MSAVLISITANAETANISSFLLYLPLPLAINSVRFKPMYVVFEQYVINTYTRNAVTLILRQ